ncbi:replication endonuclease [Methylomonas sp. CM2]|uniref:replication endonuclease n=1 Tax=Methylomonas sp. CM2 TaxID=3417647 RepID=UPI003CF2602C
MYHHSFDDRKYHIIGDFNTASPVLDYRKASKLKGSPNKVLIVDRKVSGVARTQTVNNRPRVVVDCLTRILMPQAFAGDISKKPILGPALYHTEYGTYSYPVTAHETLPSAFDPCDNPFFYGSEGHRLECSYYPTADEHVQAVRIIDSLQFDTAKKFEFLAKYFKHFGFCLPSSPDYHGLIKRCNRKFFLGRKGRQYRETRAQLDSFFGFVGKRSHQALYVADWVVDDAQKRGIRNEEYLKSTWQVSSVGVSTLYDAWESSESNPVNRRSSLMTRINGMERAAKALGYSCLFLTFTAPSDHHPSSFKYFAYTPRETLNLLNGQWNEFRTEYCKNRKIPMFGLSMIEPHKDGCPHLHKLLFCPPYLVDAIVEELSRIFLRVDGDESGAAPLPGFNHFSAEYFRVVKGEYIACEKDDDGSLPACGGRLKAVLIDDEKGSATGYVIKYVTKSLGFDVDNEDYDVQSDINFRIRAWSSLYRVRQFDFFGNPPNSLFKESRRMFQECFVNIGSKEEPNYQRLEKDGKKLCFGNQQLTDTIDRAVYHAGHSDYQSFVDAIGGFAVPKKQLALKTYSIEKLNVYGEEVKKLDGLEYETTLEENFCVAVVDRHCNHAVQWTILKCPPVDLSLKKSFDDLVSSSLSLDASYVIHEHKKRVSGFFDKKPVSVFLDSFVSKHFNNRHEFDDYVSEYSKQIISYLSSDFDFDKADIVRGALASAAMPSDGEERGYCQRASRTRINNSVIKVKQEIKEKVLFSCYPSITKRGTRVRYSHLYGNFRN